MYLDAEPLDDLIGAGILVAAGLAVLALAPRPKRTVSAVSQSVERLATAQAPRSGPQTACG